LSMGRADCRSDLACRKQDCKAELRDVTHDEVGAWRREIV